MDNLDQMLLDIATDSQTPKHSNIESDAVLYADWPDEYAKYYMKNFGTPKLLITHGQGSKVWDSKGKEYYDFLGGIAVNTLAHNNHAITETIALASKQLMHISNFFTTLPQLKLVKKLAEMVGLEHNSRSLIVNSGTEAVEGALKIAKKHAYQTNRPEAKIIALNQSFHGRSLGALSVTSKAKYREPFAPLVPNIEFIEPTIKQLQAAFAGGDTCAIILECIQGEAGVQMISTEFIEEARNLATKHNALLIIDEVQTGCGRTGKWFAYQNIPGLVPDIITVAKGLGGGFPIGAVIALGSVGDILKPGDHGTTFGGNPLACSVALTVLNTIEDERLMQNANSAFLNIKELTRSQGIAAIKEIRGSGLLVGIEFDQKIAAQVADVALQNGLIINAVNETTIRIAPALNITPTDLYGGLRIFYRSIKEVLDAN